MKLDQVKEDGWDCYGLALMTPQKDDDDPEQDEGPRDEVNVEQGHTWVRRSDGEEVKVAH